MSRLTINDLLTKCSPTVRALNPDLFPGLSLPLDVNGSGEAPKLERRSRKRSLAKGKDEKADSRRFFVRITSFRHRLLDEDNLAEKYHVDLCRYAGILPEDSASKARIVTTQEKVGKDEEERVQISIEIIP